MAIPLLGVRSGKILTHGGKLLTRKNWAPDPDPDYCYCCFCDPGAACLTNEDGKNCRLPLYVTVTFAGVTATGSCISSFPEFSAYNAAFCPCAPVGSGPPSNCGYALKNIGSASLNVAAVDPSSFGGCGYSGDITPSTDTSFQTCLRDFCNCNDYGHCSSGLSWWIFLDHVTKKLWAVIQTTNPFIGNTGWPFDEAADEGDTSHSLGENYGCFFIGSIDFTCGPMLTTGSIVIPNNGVTGTTYDHPIRWDASSFDDLWFMGTGGGTCTITCRKQVLA